MHQPVCHEDTQHVKMEPSAWLNSDHGSIDPTGPGATLSSNYDDNGWGCPDPCPPVQSNSKVFASSMRRDRSPSDQSDREWSRGATPSVWPPDVPQQQVPKMRNMSIPHGETQQPDATIANIDKRAMNRVDDLSTTDKGKITPFPDPFDGSSDPSEFKNWLSRLLRWLQKHCLDDPGQKVEPARINLLGKTLKGSVIMYYCQRMADREAKGWPWGFWEAVFELRDWFTQKSMSPFEVANFEQMQQVDHSIYGPKASPQMEKSPLTDLPTEPSFCQPSEDTHESMTSGPTIQMDGSLKPSCIDGQAKVATRYGDALKYAREFVTSTEKLKEISAPKLTIMV